MLSYVLPILLLATTLAAGCTNDREGPATGSDDDNSTEELPANGGANASDDDAGDDIAPLDPDGDKSPEAGSPRGGTRTSDGGKPAADASSDSGKLARDAGSAKADASRSPYDGSAPSGDAEQGTIIPDGPNRAPGFTDLSPPSDEPLDPQRGTAVTPMPPAGWVWYEIEGTRCRDGSPNGLYVHFAQSDSLLIYLEGGGACTSPDFCAYNPKNVNEVLAGDGQTLFGSVGGAIPGRQQPGQEGIFNLGNAANPFARWSMVYIPYCTGDVHFGTRANVQVPGVAGTQQFVGYHNMQKFIGRVAPTFRKQVKQVVLTGASAGGFGTSLNYSMVQDAFGDDALVLALNDSGPPFSDKNQPVCMQKRWRELWGFDAAFPKDCSECRQADGGGLANWGKFLQRKHPNYRIAVISSMQDEVIRAFFSSSLNDCAGFESASPVTAALGLTVPGADYVAGLTDLRAAEQPGGRFASYYMNGLFNVTFHQHIWRPRFYEAAQGNVTIAQWARDFLAGKMTQIGP